MSDCKPVKHPAEIEKELEQLKEAYGKLLTRVERLEKDKQKPRVKFQ